MLTQLAECCLLLPVLNAWLERGVSVLKRIKTRLRSRLSNSMLQSLMQMAINGPLINSKDKEDIIENCIKVSTLQKKRRKMPKPPTNTSRENTFEQMVEMVDIGVQVSDQSEKAMAAKVFEDIEKLKEEVEITSVDLKLTASLQISSIIKISWMMNTLLTQTFLMTVIKFEP